MEALVLADQDSFQRWGLDVEAREWREHDPYHCMQMPTPQQIYDKLFGGDVIEWNRTPRCVCNPGL